MKTFSPLISHTDRRGKFFRRNLSFSSLFKTKYKSELFKISHKSMAGRSPTFPLKTIHFCQLQFCTFLSRDSALERCCLAFRFAGLGGCFLNSSKMSAQHFTRRRVTFKAEQSEGHSFHRQLTFRNNPCGGVRLIRLTPQHRTIKIQLQK